MSFNQYGEIIADDQPINTIGQVTPLVTPPVTIEVSGQPPEANLAHRKLIWSIITGILAVVGLAVGGVFWYIGITNLPPSGPTSGPVPPEATPALNTAELDHYYSDGSAAFSQKQYGQATQDFEKVDQLQSQAGQTKYDVRLLLFQCYKTQGDAAWGLKNGEQFDQGLQNYKKAQAIASALPDGSRKKDQEQAIAGQLELGDLYVKGRTAGESKKWDEAITNFTRLTAKNPLFLDTPQLFYNALVEQGDTMTRSGRIPDAYSYYVLASQVANVPGGNTYAQTRAEGTKEDLRQALQPIPTVTPGWR